MRSIGRIWIVAAAVLGARPVMLAGQSGHRVAELAWLAGCWERSSGARVVEEQTLGGRARSVDFPYRRVVCP